jgi:GABA(A) receptor-associated protein
MSFRSIHCFETRANESARIRDKFPDRIPIIVEQAKHSSADLPKLDKKKYLVPGDLNLSQFIFIIRRRVSLTSDKALFMFVKGVLPVTGVLMRELYSEYKDADGFLYMEYCGENVFGYNDEKVFRSHHAKIRSLPNKYGHVSPNPSCYLSSWIPRDNRSMGN